MEFDDRPIDHAGRAIDFGRTASDYEQYRPGFPDAFFDHLMRRGWIDPDMRALDLGTGTGSVALGLASKGLDVTGLDISEELLQNGRMTAQRLGLVVSFVHGTAENTQQDGETFDLVTAGQCWWWFDSLRAVAEATRVLRPRGRLVICDFSYLPLPGNVSQRTESLILQYNPGWTKAGGTGIHPEQVEALDGGRFHSVESFSYVIDVPFTHETWRGRIRTCNGVGSTLDKPDVERFDRDLAEMLLREFPDELSIPHRIFATSGLSP